MNSNTRQVKTFIGMTALAAAGCATYAGIGSHTLHGFYSLALLALAAATSRMKVKLPGIDGNMSVNLPFLLAAAVNLSALEAVAITLVSTVVQCWPKRDAKFKPEQMVFNLSMMALANTLASLTIHSAWLAGKTWTSEPLAIALAATTLFAGQTLPVATVIALSENGKVAGIWWNLAQLSFPYYVVSAGMSSMMQTVDHRLGTGAALAVFPVMYGIHRSYRVYFRSTVEALRTTPITRAAGAGA